MQNRVHPQNDITKKPDNLEKSISFKKVSAFLHKNIAVIAVILPIISIIIQWITKCILYWYKCGYYNYFGIDHKYIQIDYETTWINILTTAAILLIAVPINKVFCNWYLKQKLWVKFLLVVSQMIINMIIVELSCLFLGFSIQEILYQFIPNLSYWIKWGIAISMIIDLAIFALYFVPIPVRLSHIEPPKKITYSKLIVLIVIISFALVLTTFIFYQTNNESAHDQKTFEIAEIENKSYAILSSRDDEFYVCECSEDDKLSLLTIHKNKYMFTSLNQSPIERKTYKGIILSDVK